MRYILLIFSLILSYESIIAQPFPKAPFKGFLGGEELIHPFLGGLNNPFAQNIDMDLDGRDELWLLDRSGEVNLIYRFTDNKWVYDEALSRLTPRLNEWILVDDFNKDGLDDVFTNSLVQGVAGISVFYGVEQNGMLTFNFATFPQFKFDIISYESRPGQFTNAYVAPGDLPAIGDVDYDGDLDILSFEPGGLTIHFYKNTQVEDGLPADQFHFVLDDVCWGKVVEDGLSAAIILGNDTVGCGNFLNKTPVEIRHAGSSLMLIERNGDRRHDLLVGDIGSTSMLNLINTGSLQNAFITDIKDNFPAETEKIDLAIYPFSMQVDFDQDGIVDLMASPGDLNNGENLNNLWLYKNFGSDTIPIYSLTSKHILGQDMFDFGSLSVPTVLDFNGDGLKDILVGTRGVYPAEILSDSRLIYLENNGAKGFLLKDNDLLGLSSFQSETAILSPAAGDLDGDGDMDLVIGEASGRLIYLENIAGADDVPVFNMPILPYQNIDVGVQSHPAIYDVNEDGLNDLVIGERNGNLNYFENIGVVGNPVFTPEPTDGFFGGVDVRETGFVSGSSTPFITKIESGCLLLTGSQSGVITAYRPELTNGESFQIIDSLWGGILEGENTCISMADLEGDGFLEAIVGNQRGGIAIYSTGLLDLTTTTSSYNEEKSKIHVFPIPVENTLTIKSTVNESFELSLYTYTGQLVEFSSFRQEAKLDLNLYDPGIYILKARSKKLFFIKKIIVL